MTKRHVVLRTLNQNWEDRIEALSEKKKKKLSSRQGPPKHQNKFAWIPNAYNKQLISLSLENILLRKTNSYLWQEVGGKFRPYSEITGVCLRCKEQIDWKRHYGKYKSLTIPAKWNFLFLFPFLLDFIVCIYIYIYHILFCPNDSNVLIWFLTFQCHVNLSSLLYFNKNF